MTMTTTKTKTKTNTKTNTNINTIDMVSIWPAKRNIAQGPPFELIIGYKEKYRDKYKYKDKDKHKYIKRTL